MRSALLAWCQACTCGYPGVSVRDFGRSWADGRALLALLHRHQPQLFAEGIEGALRACRTPRDRLRMAFDLARDHLGMHPLLDPEGTLTASGPTMSSLETTICGLLCFCSVVLLLPRTNDDTQYTHAQLHSMPHTTNKRSTSFIHNNFLYFTSIMHLYEQLVLVGLIVPHSTKHISFKLFTYKLVAMHLNGTI